MKRYNLGGQKYTQQPLVLGQYKQLLDVLGGVKLGGSAVEIMTTLGDKVPLAAAIVLQPVKPWPLSLLCTPQRKNIHKLAKRLSHTLDVDASFEVMADFFDCNPVQTAMERLAGVIQAQQNGSNQPSSTLPTEISPKES
jgi:hypothetical protein